MDSMPWLVSWIGKTDRDASEGKTNGEYGPIATALRIGKRYDRIYLLTNYEFAASQRYCAWLERETGYKAESVDLYQVDLTSLIDYGSIYTEVASNLKQAGLPRVTSNSLST